MQLDEGTGHVRAGQVMPLGHVGPAKQPCVSNGTESDVEHHTHAAPLAATRSWDRGVEKAKTPPTIQPPTWHSTQLGALVHQSPRHNESPIKTTSARSPIER